MLALNLGCRDAKSGDKMKIKCAYCKYKGKLSQFISGLGSLLVCPKCGGNFLPPVMRKKGKGMKKKLKKNNSIEDKAIKYCAKFLQKKGWKVIVGGFSRIEQEAQYKFNLIYSFLGKKKK